MARIDDEELPNDAMIWRRILPSWITVDDEGKCRLQSLGFLDRRTGEVSVSVASLTDEKTALEGHPDDSLVAFAAGIPRKAGGMVAKTPEVADPAHRVLIYENPSRMRKAAQLIAQPENYQWVVLKPPPEN